MQVQKINVSDQIDKLSSFHVFLLSKGAYRDKQSSLNTSLAKGVCQSSGTVQHIVLQE